MEDIFILDVACLKMPSFIFVLVRFTHQNHYVRLIQFILIEMPPKFWVFGKVLGKALFM